MSFKRITRIISVLAALMILIFNEGCNHAPSDVADVRPAAEITSGPMIDSVYEAHPLISVSISTEHNELKDDQILNFGVIDSDTNELTPILGNYQRTEALLTFTPSFALLPGITYQAQNLVSNTHTNYSFEQAHATTPTLEVKPNSDNLPANHLKFYLFFSQPMQQDTPWEHCKLYDVTTGNFVGRPFRHTDLWNPDGKRLTLWFHPGRQKTGVNLNVDLGAILEEGHEYELLISGLWQSLEGQPLGKDYRLPFTATKADHMQPDPSQWVLIAPESGTQQPLTIEFNERLDYAMLHNQPLTVTSGKTPIDCQIVPNTDSTKLELTPSDNWIPGTYSLNINPRLEDLAGNSIERPFEVDIQEVNAEQSKTTTITFTLAP